MHQMKTAFLVLWFAALPASGQVITNRNQRAAAYVTTQPAQTAAPGANYSSGAEYVQVSLVPTAGGANNQGNSRRAARQQARTVRGTEYVTVSVAPRR